MVVPWVASTPVKNSVGGDGARYERVAVIPVINPRTPTHTPGKDKGTGAKRAQGKRAVKMHTVENER